MRKIPKCQCCGTNDAVWAMQYIGEETATFTRLGSHYRGFKVRKVCDDCRKSIKEYEKTLPQSPF